VVDELVEIDPDCATVIDDRGIVERQTLLLLVWGAMSPGGLVGATLTPRERRTDA
jgi:hypothetical protein